MDEKLRALKTYFDLMSMKGGVEVFQSALKSGVLDALAKEPLTQLQLSNKAGIAPRAAELILRVLKTLGLVEQEGETFQVSPAAGFLTGTYRDLSDQYWAYLPTFMQTGEPMQHMDNPAESEQAYRQQARSLHWMMLPSAMTLAGMLGIGQQGVPLNILDVGAGSGVWSLTCAQHAPGSTITLADWPAVIEVAREFATQAGLDKIVKECPGNYHDVEFDDAAYDLIILGNVAHLETEQSLTSLLTKLRSALSNDGQLLMIDVFHEQPGGELQAALYELGLALRTESGRVHGCNTLGECLREAGMEQTTYQPISAPPFTMGMITATKGE